MSSIEQNRPLIAESSTSESTNLETVLDDFDQGVLSIPDYQRDSDQWADEAKSLLVESVINNLSIPAFFFEVVILGGIEKKRGNRRTTAPYDPEGFF